MLTVWEAIQQRRSIRRYTDNDVSDAMIDQMLEAARLAPSGSNAQPWRFIVVRDLKVKDDICQLSYGQRFIVDAPVAIVCLTDLSCYSQERRKNMWNEIVESGMQTEFSGQIATREFWDKVASMPFNREVEFKEGSVSNPYCH
ncbi:MAG: nitroreductase family protein [Chloroflexota bacterium]